MNQMHSEQLKRTLSNQPIQKHKIYGMRNSKQQIQQQYKHLKCKVEGQIKVLEQKLAQNSQIHYHRYINSPKNLQVPPENQYHLRNSRQCSQRNTPRHYCSHHLKNSHLNCSRQSGVSCKCCHSQMSLFQGQEHHSQTHLLSAVPTTVKYNRNQSNLQQNDQSGNQNLIYRNQFLEQAFLKSLQNQKELTQSLRHLSYKIEKLQNKSKARSSSNIFRDSRSHLRNSSSQQNSCSDRIQRAKSMVRGEHKLVLDQYTLKNIPTHPCKSSHSGSKLSRKQKSSRRNSKSNNQYFINPKQQKTIKNPSIQHQRGKKGKGSSFDQNWKKQYYGTDRLCPIHSSPKAFKLKSKQKEVYQDTFHRNRKHQRDHLIQSFRQQEIARKKLIQKILRTQGLQLKIK